MCGAPTPAGVERPEGVARTFHVSVYKVEPSEAVLARHLLANDSDRAALLDEIMERWPKVPLVSKPSSSACRAERLAWCGACPHGPVVGPTRASECVRPDADASEKVALGVPGQVFRPDVFDTSFVDIARCDVPCGDEVAQPLGCVGVELVVVSICWHLLFFLLWMLKRR